MSTEIRGRPGYNITASTQKLSETATTELSSSWAACESQSHANAQCQPAAGNVESANIALQHGEIETSLTKVSVIDKQKVAQLRQAIQGGTYRIDAKRIADKLIALERILSK